MATGAPIPSPPVLASSMGLHAMLGDGAEAEVPPLHSGRSSIASSAPSATFDESSKSASETSLSSVGSYGFPRRDSPDYANTKLPVSPSSARKTSVPSLAGSLPAAMEPYAFGHHLGKQRGDGAVHLSVDGEDVTTPMAHPAQEARGIDWNKRRSSAFSDHGARFGALQLGNGQASSAEDLRRGSIASVSSTYSAYDQPAYPHPQPGGGRDQFTYHLPHSSASDAPGYNGFSDYGFPPPDARPQTSGMESSTSSSFGTSQASPQSSHQSPFLSEQESDQQRAFPRSDGGEPSPALGGAINNPRKDTPYSRSPEMRVSHKMAERKRRKEMKDLFDELREVLPVERGMKASKWETLTAAVDHIRNLEATASMDRRRIYELETLLSRVPPMAAPPPPPPFPPTQPTHSAHYVNMPQPLAHPSSLQLSHHHPHHPHAPLAPDMVAPHDDMARPTWPPRQMSL